MPYKKKISIYISVNSLKGNPLWNQPSPELFIAISNTRYTRLGTIKYKDSSVVAPVESIKKY